MQAVGPRANFSAMALTPAADGTSLQFDSNGTTTGFDAVSQHMFQIVSGSGAGANSSALALLRRTAGTILQIDDDGAATR